MGGVCGGGLGICWFALGKVDLVIFGGSNQFRWKIFRLEGAGGGGEAPVMMIALHHVLALTEGV